jgi:hypothetical protein
MPRKGEVSKRKQSGYLPDLDTQEEAAKIWDSERRMVKWVAIGV